MAKKAKREKAPKTPRRNTNGSGEVAPPAQTNKQDDSGMAALAMGPIVLPSPEDSQRVLEELATLHHRLFTAELALKAQKDKTKIASEKVEEISAQILERLRVATHATGLPLFEELEKVTAKLEEQART